MVVALLTLGMAFVVLSALLLFSRQGKSIRRKSAGGLKYEDAPYGLRGFVDEGVPLQTSLPEFYSSKDEMMQELEDLAESCSLLHLLTIPREDPVGDVLGDVPGDPLTVVTLHTSPVLLWSEGEDGRDWDGAGGVKVVATPHHPDASGTSETSEETSEKVNHGEGNRHCFAPLSSPESASVPVVVMEAGQHGRELITSEIALALVRDVCRRETEWTDVLERVAVVVVPLANPSGRELVETRDACVRKTGEGTDPNRNWEYRFKQEAATEDETSGPHPYSTFEARSVHNVLTALSDARGTSVVAYVNIHSGIAEAYGPMDSEATNLAAKPYASVRDACLFQQLERVARAGCNTPDCPVGSAGHIAGYLAFGTSADTVYAVMGVPHVYTLEVYGDPHSNYCFRMFNPYTESAFTDVVTSWTNALSILVWDVGSAFSPSRVLPLFPDRFGAQALSPSRVFRDAQGMSLDSDGSGEDGHDHDGESGKGGGGKGGGEGGMEGRGGGRGGGEWLGIAALGVNGLVAWGLFSLWRERGAGDQ